MIYYIFLICLFVIYYFGNIIQFKKKLYKKLFIMEGASKTKKVKQLNECLILLAFINGKKSSRKNFNAFYYFC